jgi:hypothetical protein
LRGAMVKMTWLLPNKPPSINSTVAVRS